MKAPAPGYTLKIVPSPGFRPETETARLRRALKALGRSYGFRCVACLPEPPKERAA